MTKAKYLNKSTASYLDYLIRYKDAKKLYDFMRANRFIRFVRKFQEWAYKLMLILKDDPNDQEALNELYNEMRTVIKYVKNKQLQYNSQASLRYYRRQKKNGTNLTAPIKKSKNGRT